VARRKASKKAAPLGTGQRFKSLTRKLAARGVRNPSALAAYIGRRKYGKAGMAALSAAGRKRKAAARKRGK
jgi:hypothetical protein